jgi:hypothetical protein
MSDPEIYALRSKWNINVLEEASYVLWYLWRAIHPAYTKLEPCVGALRNDDTLYKALKSAHACGKYDPVRYWGTSIVVVTVLQVLISHRFLSWAFRAQDHPNRVCSRKNSSGASSTNDPACRW